MDVPAGITRDLIIIQSVVVAAAAFFLAGSIPPAYGTSWTQLQAFDMHGNMLNGASGKICVVRGGVWWCYA